MSCHPIQFSIPESKIITAVPEKIKDFSDIIPSMDVNNRNYTFNCEEDYYGEYQQSYFAITMKKAGWDCLRHYEILANGCIPYFINLENCPDNQMTLLPKGLILDAMKLEGVSRGKIDHSVFDKKKYFNILESLLDYTRKMLTCKKSAENILRTVMPKGWGHKILFISFAPSSTDYLRDLTLIGLKQNMGKFQYVSEVIDYPRIDHIYTDYRGKTSDLYGRGFTYSKVIETNDSIDDIRSNSIRDIAVFDLIIYGTIHHRGLPLHDIVKEHYPKERVIYLCGEDDHICEYKSNYFNLFIRDF